MRQITVLTVISAVGAVAVAALPFAIVQADLRIIGRSFAVVQVGVGLAGVLAVVASVVAIRAKLNRVRLAAYALAATGLLQTGLATTLVVALLLPPPYEWAIGVVLFNLLIPWMTALLAVCVALGTSLSD